MNNTDFQGWFLNLINKSLSNNRDYFYKLSEQSDKIIVWLVGFSATSIALSINKEIELDKLIHNFTLYVVIFGSSTIIFGVLYRIFLFLAQSVEIKILIAFEGFIDGYNNPPNIHFGRILTEKNTYDEIVTFLKDDFKIEIERIDTSRLNPTEIEALRKSVIDYYLSLNNWSNNKLEREKNEIKTVLSNYLGYSNKKIEQIFNPKESKIKLTSIYWFSIYTASTLFILSCLSFTIGMILILFGYLTS